MPAYRDDPKRMEDLSPIFATSNPTWADVQNSLVVQWLGLRAPTAEGTGSILGRGTRIPHAMQHGPPPPEKRFRQSL